MLFSKQWNQSKFPQRCSLSLQPLNTASHSRILNLHQINTEVRFQAPSWSKIFFSYFVPLYSTLNTKNSPLFIICNQNGKQSSIIRKQLVWLFKGLKRFQNPEQRRVARRFNKFDKAVPESLGNYLSLENVV